MPPVQRVGAVTSVTGLIIESEGPNVGLGDLCIVRSPRTDFSLQAEVVGFREHRVLLMPLGRDSGPARRVRGGGRRPPADPKAGPGTAWPRAGCARQAG